MTVLVRRTEEDRFLAKVHFTDSCWLWTASLDTWGYGLFRISRTRLVKAHRYSYEQLVGSIPEGLTLDHLCRVRRCVRPEHLEPVTQAENNLRGMGLPAINARKTHCDKGHPFHTYANGSRKCRACRKERDRERRHAS